MVRDAALKVIDYSAEEGIPVQITFEGGTYTADFKNRPHAIACYEEMLESGFKVLIEFNAFCARLL